MQNDIKSHISSIQILALTLNNIGSYVDAGESGICSASALWIRMGTN